MGDSLVEQRKVCALERIADLLAKLVERPATPPGIEWTRKEGVYPQCSWAGTPHYWTCPYATPRQIGVSGCGFAGSASVPVPPRAGCGISLTGNGTTTTKGEQ